MALQEATGEPVVIAETLLRATTLLRSESYVAAVFDRQLVETEPHQTDMALAQLGTAIPVQVNLGITGTERVVREVRDAMQRRKLEEATALEAATRALHGELNGTLTTLLLDCKLALETPGLSPAATDRLVSVHETAQKLRAQLGAGEKVGY